MRNVAGTAISRTVVTFARLTRGEPGPLFSKVPLKQIRATLRPSALRTTGFTSLLQSGDFCQLGIPSQPRPSALAMPTVQYLRIAGLPLVRGDSVEDRDQSCDGFHSYGTRIHEHAPPVRHGRVRSRYA